VGARIVVVDDNIANLTFITFLVEAFGHRVLPASSGEEALGLVTDNMPDLVLLDLQMPVMDGFETLRLLRQNPMLNGIPVVAVTALAMVGDRDVALAAGFNGYITKPIQPEEFAAQIDPFLPAGSRSRMPGGVVEEQ
jgi:CheY-like chemotaxis protein